MEKTNAAGSAQNRRFLLSGQPRPSSFLAEMPTGAPVRGETEALGVTVFNTITIIVSPLVFHPGLEAERLHMINGPLCLDEDKNKVV